MNNMIYNFPIECDTNLCAACSDLTTCTKECNEGCNTCENTGRCIGPSCKPGYSFQAGGICKLDCNTKCVTCESTDINICTGPTCNGSNRNPSNNCECNSDSIEILGNCLRNIIIKILLF